MSPFLPAYLGPRYRTEAPPPALTPIQADVRRRTLEENRAADWESVDCLCGASGGHVLTEVDRYGLPYRKVVCMACGLLRVTPRWTAVRYARFYEHHYRDLYSPLSEKSATDTLVKLAQGAGAALVGAFVEKAWRRFGDPHNPRPAVLEIGAGGGWNLSRLPGEWTRIGFDFDERFLQAGRAAFGVDLRRGFLPEAMPVVAEADCILLSHVLEHVPSPIATLRELAAVARPDALILLEVPGIFRLHKTSLDPMRYWQNAHTFTFCARTAVDTCRRAGLEPLAVDEWIRLVLRASSLAEGPVRNDPRLARSVERYLRYCENSYRLALSCARLPLLGSKAVQVARLSADAIMRAAVGLQLIHGMRADVATADIPAFERFV